MVAVALIAKASSPRSHEGGPKVSRLTIAVVAGFCLGWLLIVLILKRTVFRVFVGRNLPA